MTIDRKTASQFVQQLRTAILDRTKRYDVGFDAIPDVITTPIASVLEDQNNNRLRRVSLLLSLQNVEAFSDSELDGIVFNEGLERPTGSLATTTLTFRRLTPFGSGDSGLISRGTPIGTTAGDTSGQTVTFVTAESKDKTTAVAVIDTDTNATVYENEITAIAIVRGSGGSVGPNRVTRPLRPLVGYDSVTNKEAAQDGRDRFSQTELVELYLLATSSRQLSVPSGSEFHVKDTYLSVEDANEVFGTDPLLTRSGTDAGAVDSFILGETLLSQTDTMDYSGVGQRMYLTLPPVVRIDSVIRVSDSTEFIEDTDFELILDSSGNGGSTRARDAIRFLASATTMPTVGDSIAISYTYNDLIRILQDDASDDEVSVEGRDLLFRTATRVDIFLSAQLKATSGFNSSDIKSLVTTQLQTFFDSLKLGDDVEGSDIQGTVRQLTGVDNFVITKLTTSATGTGTVDIPIASNEYARLDTSNLSIVTI